MIALIALLSAAACPQTKVVNRSNLPWNDWDKNRMNYCKERCPYEYSDSPCLKAFFKLGARSYYCLCGKAKD
jgi:hypothetical protein